MVTKILIYQLRMDDTLAVLCAEGVATALLTYAKHES